MNETENQEIRIPVGEQLKHLREQKNLSVQDIASRLNLEARIIEAIEQNDFEILSAATYARGYLRSYAKILGADADAIISSFNDSAPEPPEIIPEVKHPTQTSSSDKPVKAFTYLISLTLVILLIAWWQSNFIVDNMNFMVNKDMASDADNAYGLSYPVQIVEHPTSPFYRAEEARGEESAVADESDTKVEVDLKTVTGTGVLSGGPGGAGSKKWKARFIFLLSSEAESVHTWRSRTVFPSGFRKKNCGVLTRLLSRRSLRASSSMAFFSERHLTCFLIDGVITWAIFLELSCEIWNQAVDADVQI